MGITELTKQIKEQRNVMEEMKKPAFSIDIEAAQKEIEG